ncbi:DedA family protein [Microbacteriaceae bacterium 4G12]
MEQQLLNLLMHYGYWGLIIALAGGIIGLPVPDELLLTFVGYNVAEGNMFYIAALASGFAGATLGITISYILGLKLGLPALRKYGSKFRITEDKIQRTHQLFEKYGPFLLVMAFFLPGIRHLVAYFAGLSDLTFRRFCMYAYFGALVWVSFFILLGWKLGDQWRHVSGYLHQYGLYLVFVSLLIGTGIFIYFQVMRKVKQS